MKERIGQHGLLKCLLTASLFVLFVTPAMADKCSDLATLPLTGVTAITATQEAANSFTFKAPFPGMPDGQPIPFAFCRVQLTVEPQIQIEVWLPQPEDWNHRFEAEGGGGYAGGVTTFALAQAIVGDSVKGHFATASTDTGHPAAGTENGQGAANGAQSGGGFALNPTDHTLNHGLISDFASRAEHETAEKAKALIRAYYGEGPKYSYWNGCSTGGRQGLMEAQKFPDDYDGILAGAPAINWDRFIPAELWPALIMKVDAGGPIAAAKLNLATAAATKACDGLDGVVDGVIADPRQCKYDPHLLQCGKPNAPTDGTCLSKGEADAIQSIWQGARGPKGESLWYGVEPGDSLDFLAAPSPFNISLDYWRLWIKQDPAFDWKTLDVASFAAGFGESRKKFHDAIGTDNPDLSKFQRHGGKILTYHGWADQLIFPQGSIDYFNRAVAANGGLDRLEKFYRLYMVPGMGHCAGGVGAYDFGQAMMTPSSLDAQHDAALALIDWVEKGTAPEAFIASKGGMPMMMPAAVPDATPPNLTRLICPFPKVAHYNGTGDANSSASFTCVKTAQQVHRGEK